MPRAYRDGDAPEAPRACLFCGAPVRGATCGVCGEQTAPIDASRAADLSIRCPRCFVALELEEQKGGAAFLYCIGCHGCFVPPADFAQMLDAFDPDAPPGENLVPLSVGQGLRHGVLERAVMCPVCDGPMKRAPFARAGDTIDVCILHGIWFDAAELAHIVAGTREAEREAQSAETAENKPRDVLAAVARILFG